MQKLIIFGIGKISDVVSGFFEHDPNYDVVAYCIDDDWLDQSPKSFRGKPVVSYSSVEAQYPCAESEMFIAIGYHDMNQVRADKFASARAKGYRLASCVSPLSYPGPDRLTVGENVLVMDGASVQNGAKLGENVMIWSNVTVGHHAEMADHVWISSNSVIGGNTLIDEKCLLGLNVTVGHELTVGKRCFFGAKTLLTKNAEEGGVYIASDTARLRLDIDHFMKITTMS